MKPATKGGVILEEIKIGDIHYEFEYGCGIKCEVITRPERVVSGEYAQWKWKSKNLNNPDHIIDYMVTEGLSHYGPNLYDHEAYGNVKYV
jgi:hypothetical protein